MALCGVGLVASLPPPLTAPCAPAHPVLAQVPQPDALFLALSLFTHGPSPGTLAAPHLLGYWLPAALWSALCLSSRLRQSLAQT